MNGDGRVLYKWVSGDHYQWYEIKEATDDGKLVIQPTGETKCFVTVTPYDEHSYVYLGTRSDHLHKTNFPHERYFKCQTEARLAVAKYMLKEAQKADQQAIIDLANAKESVRKAKDEIQVLEEVKGRIEVMLSQRFRLEIRSGIIAVVDTKHPEYKETPGCHGEYPWVVAYWQGSYNKKKHYWEMQDWQNDRAAELVALLNLK